jgi:predicted dehydrogenase
MKIGVVGLGYWGPNLVRNLYGLQEVEEVIACDPDEDRINFIRNRYPGIKTTGNYEDLLNGKCSAILIATPVDTHYPLAKKALLAKKHVWVEKPFTSNVEQAKELIKIADANGLKIFVDHTFIYTGAVRKIKELVDTGELGDVIYFDSVRINLGLFQSDVNVIWDLAPHDLSIMNYIIPEKQVTSVTASGISNYYDKENIAQLSFNFKEQSCFAHFHVNWTSPVKIRRMIIAGNKKMLVFDDMENSEKIKVYDCGVEFNSKESIHKLLVQYRTGDMYSPKVIHTEALTLAAQEFIDSIKEDRQPLTNAIDGLEVVKMLEAADKSIKNKGALIYIQGNERILNFELKSDIGNKSKSNLKKVEKAGLVT